MICDVCGSRYAVETVTDDFCGEAETYNQCSECYRAEFEEE